MKNTSNGWILVLCATLSVASFNFLAKAASAADSIGTIYPATDFPYLDKFNANTSETQVPQLKQDASPRALKDRWAAEANFGVLGGFGTSTNNSQTLGSSEIVGSAQLRSFLSDELALTISLPVFAAISKESAKTGNYRQLYPVMIGFRYQFSSLVNNARMKPWVEAETGVTLTSSPQYQEDGSLGSLVNTQTSARAATGFDYFFSNAQDLYCGFRFSYFMAKDLSNPQTSVSMGYVF